MITVMISTYNHSHYLPIQLASVFRQGPSVSRIIVVNDGSTDDTAAVLAKIQLNEPRLMVKNLTENVGYVNAVHIGLRYVETDFFALAAADDFLMPDWAEKSLNAIQSAPGIGLCLSRTFTANETTDTLNKTILPKRVRGAVLSPREFHHSLMQYGSWGESNTMLIRRSAYDEKFVEFESAGAFADGLTICVLGLKAGAVVVDEPLGVFFVREGSVSGGTVAPRVGVTLLKALSHILASPSCVELIDRRLAFRIVRRNTYTYLMGSAHYLTSKFSKLAERILPPIASRALQISLRLLFTLYRLMAFVCLRPFDFMVAKRIYTHAATLDETRTFYEYQKVLNESLPSIGLDI